MSLREIILNKTKDLQKAAIKNNLKTKFIYKKIINHLEHDTTPILTLSQIKKIPNVGPKTYNLYVEFINKELEEKIKSLEDLEKFSLVLKNEVTERIRNKLVTPIKRKQYETNGVDKPFEVSNESTLDESPILLEVSNESDLEESPIQQIPYDDITFSRSLSTSEELKTSKKQYIPGFRTGSYAILRALWEEDGISKHKIAYLGKDFTDSEFDFTSKASAWSSIKTLIAKGLVYKESGTKIYFLTEKGKDLSEILFKDHQRIRSEDKTVTLLIDSREIKNRNCRSFFQSYFDSLNYETRNLSVGDFAWIQNENVCNFIVERKCGSDLISSIVDGRFKEQKKRLLETGFKRIYYIIEGLKSQHMKKINEEFAYYCILSSKVEGFTVIETKDINETAKVIEKLDIYIKSSQDQEDFQLMSYGSFLDKGSKSRALNINCILFYMFLSINGITQTKAKLLSSYFKTPKNLFQSISSNEFKSILENQFLKNNLITKRNSTDLTEIFCKY